MASKAAMSNLLHPQWMIIGEILVIATCLVGDKLLEQGPSKTWTKALSDSLTHGLVGFFSWLIVKAEIRAYAVVEMMLCMLMAMFVDVDHFLAAWSFSINDATHLAHRPPFHNSSLIIIITLLLIMLSRTWPGPPSTIMDNIPLIFAVAWASHHIRDGTRRGLWFYPFGSTRPLPKCLYIGCTMVLPLLVRLLLSLAPETTQLKLKSSGTGILNV